MKLMHDVLHHANLACWGSQVLLCVGACILDHTVAKISGADKCFSRVQSSLPKVDQLMLEAFTQMSEPDSIYAMTRSPSLAVQLPLAEHEGSWAEALAGHDLQLHQMHQTDHDLISGSQPIGRGSLEDVKDRQQQGLFNALQQLGCQHVLQKLFLSESVQLGEIAHFK